MAEKFGESMKLVGKGLLWIGAGVLALDFVVGGIGTDVANVLDA